MKPNHRHLSDKDCLKVRTVCLVSFISAVNGHRKKRGLESPTLVAGTYQNSSNLFWTFDIYEPNGMGVSSFSFNYMFDKNSLLLQSVTMEQRIFASSSILKFIQKCKNAKFCCNRLQNQTVFVEHVN